jgi:hypothetical protein
MRASKRVQESQAYFPLWIWCVFFLGLWQILLWAQPPSILMDDSGEMIAASWNLGLPHPPGYPLFDLLGHVFSWVAVGSASFRFSLLSSLIVLISLAVVLKTCRILINQLNLKQSLSALKIELLLVFIALAFIFNSTIFSQSLSAKGCVYALTLLLISVLVWLCVLKTNIKLIYLAWFLWGLGLASHWQTAILLAPFLVVFSGMEMKMTVKNLFLMGSVVLFGLSLYLYLPLRAALKTQPSWGDPLHWDDFKWVVFRQLVAGEEMKVHSFAFYRECLWAVLQSIQLWFPGVVVLMILGLWKINRENKPLARLFWILILPILLALIAVHEQNNLYLIPVYLMPLLGLVSLLILTGLLWLLTKKGSAFQLTVLLVLIFFGAFWGWTVFETQNRSRYTLAEDFGVNTMKFLPRGAVLLADGDNYVMPLWYLKYALGKRPDLVIEPMVFLFHDWGWNQLALQSADLKELIQSSAVYSQRLTSLVENRQQSFFYSFGRQFWPGTLNHVAGQWVPRGLVYGWTSSPALDKDQKLILKNLGLLERQRELGENRSASFSDPPTNDLYRGYTESFLAAAGWFRSQRDDLSALSKLDSSLLVQTDSAMVYADMASLVGQRGYLKMAQTLCQIAIKFDPTNGTAQSNLAKLNGHRAHLSKDKGPAEYKKWSETLEKAGCPFLSQLALNCSESMIKPIN